MEFNLENFHMIMCYLWNNKSEKDFMIHKSCEFISDLKARRKASKQLECKVTHLKRSNQRACISSVAKLFVGSCLLTAPSPMLLADLFIGIQAVKGHFFHHRKNTKYIWQDALLHRHACYSLFPWSSYSLSLSKTPCIKK